MILINLIETILAIINIIITVIHIASLSITIIIIINPGIHHHLRPVNHIHSHSHHNHHPHHHIHQPVAESFAESYLPGEDGHVGESSPLLLHHWIKATVSTDFPYLQ